MRIEKPAWSGLPCAASEAGVLVIHLALLERIALQIDLFGRQPGVEQIHIVSLQAGHMRPGRLVVDGLRCIVAAEKAR